MRRRTNVRFRTVVAVVVAIGSAVAVAAGVGGVQSAAGVEKTTTLNGIHRIRHVVVIQQENRSFDSYFGTFPAPMAYR
jgi:phospholipase C